MVCKNCNYDLLPTIKNVGPHVGAYCSFCGKWIKWLDKQEARQCKALESTKSNNQNLDITNVNSLYGKLTNSDNNGEVPW